MKLVLDGALASPPCWLSCWDSWYYPILSRMNEYQEMAQHTRQTLISVFCPLGFCNFLDPCKMPCPPYQVPMLHLTKGYTMHWWTFVGCTVILNLLPLILLNLYQCHQCLKVTMMHQHRRCMVFKAKPHFMSCFFCWEASIAALLMAFWYLQSAGHW